MSFEDTINKIQNLNIVYPLERWRKVLTKSIILHVSITLILLLLGSQIFSFLGFSKKETIIQGAVKVDVIAMPKMTLKELKALSPAPQPIVEPLKVESKAAPEEVADDAPKFKEVAKKKDFLSKLKKLSKKKMQDSDKPKTNKKVQEKVIDQSKLNKLIYAGNKLSTGSAATGETTSAQLSEYHRYITALPDLVRPYFKLPGYLIDKGLNCRIQVYIGKNGDIVKMSIHTSSGDDEFDQRALNAIESAAPFPAPSEAVRQSLSRGDLVLGFPL